MLIESFVATNAAVVKEKDKLIEVLKSHTIEGNCYCFIVLIQIVVGVTESPKCPTLKYPTVSGLKI